MIGLFIEWFDVFNTQHKYDKGCKSFGLDEENQRKLINKMTEFIKNLKIHNKVTLLSFPKGNN